MADLLTPQDIERLATAAGLTVTDICRRAGVAASIFSRWKAGKTEPNMESYRRIRDAALAAEPLTETTKRHTANDATKPAKRSRTPVKPPPKRRTRAADDTTTAAEIAA